MRRFTAGQTGEIGGVHWRIVQGKKHTDDLRLDIRVPSWTPVKMDVGFLFADFFKENEDVLYPPPRYRGGQMYLDYCEGAARVGWQHASDTLRSQRERKRAA